MEALPHLYLYLYQGRVEVLVNGSYLTTCGDYFGPRAAAVVCKQLGPVFLKAGEIAKCWRNRAKKRLWLAIGRRPSPARAG